MPPVYINPHIPLVKAVTAWLEGEVRLTPAGVKSLAHLLVVVPTRQAGRRLRLALAEATGGCLPPLIRLPYQVILPAQEPPLPVATPAETLACLSRLLGELDLHAFPNLFPAQGLPSHKSFGWSLSIARQLNELWTLLQENALNMADVAAQIETLLADENLDVEVQRWHDLAALEERFFAALEAQGRTPPSRYRKNAVAQPRIPAGVERIVLPGLVDAQPALYAVLDTLSASLALTVLIHADASQASRFDRWGRPEPSQWLGREAPVLPLRDEEITLAANSAEQARIVAQAFAAIPPAEELPSLGLVDDTLFSELQSAFLVHGLHLHNPAAYPLSTASLGRLIHQLEGLRTQPRFPLLAAFLREADVRRWLQREHAALPYTALLAALDELQNTHLPQTLQEVSRFCDSHVKQAEGHEPWTSLGTVLAAVRTLVDPKGRPRLEHLLVMLQTLFHARTLEASMPGDRELAAAATAAHELFEALASPVVATTLEANQQSQLFEALLSETTYQLEPDEPETLLTEGWLELAWSPAQELLITGFNEGSIPDAVVGHAFLPDKLRKGLGMTCNDRRTARDTYLLQALLLSRPPQAVRLTLERVSSRNDVRKPSRLLFLCDETTLARRAKKLFRDAESSAAGFPRSLPEAWRLQLPLPQHPLNKLSVTALKAYLECPFTFYLSHVLKMETCDDRTAELDAPSFGNLCHHALERFGTSALKDATDAEAIAEFLEAEVWSTLHDQCGDALPAVIHLQALSACQRLRFFAAAQASWRRGGQQIRELEKPLSLMLGDFTLKGRADRIDYCPETDTWFLLDYKTWDKLGKHEGVARFASNSLADITAAAELGVSPFDFEGKPRVWTDLQLPLYLLMAQAGGRFTADTRVRCGYCVLGETAEETRFVTWDFSGYRDHAFDTVKKIVSHVQAGRFWPPSPKDVWTRNFASLILESPEKSLSAAWLEDQQARLAKGGQP